MGTLNTPGQYDCLKNLDPDEPYFLIRGKDVWGAFIVRLWIRLRRWAGHNKTEPEVLAEAAVCADAMERWCKNLGRSPIALPLVRTPAGRPFLAWPEDVD